MADDSVQPVPWVLGRLAARPPQLEVPVGADRDVDRLGTVEMPPFTSTTRGPKREDPLRRGPHVRRSR